MVLFVTSKSYQVYNFSIKRSNGALLLKTGQAFQNLVQLGEGDGGGGLDPAPYVTSLIVDQWQQYMSHGTGLYSELKPISI